MPEEEDDTLIIFLTTDTAVVGVLSVSFKEGGSKNWQVPTRAGGTSVCTSYKRNEPSTRGRSVFPSYRFAVSQMDLFVCMCDVHVLCVYCSIYTLLGRGALV